MSREERYIYEYIYFNTCTRYQPRNVMLYTHAHTSVSRDCFKVVKSRRFNHFDIVIYSYISAGRSYEYYTVIFKL